MSDQIGVVIVELVHGEAQVAVVEENEQRLGAGDEHVAAYVELALVDEQRVVNVLLYDAAEWLGNAESTLLAVLGELKLLTQRLRTAHQVDALALIQRHRLAYP